MRKVILFSVLGAMFLAVVGCGAGGHVTESDTLDKQKEIDATGK